MTDPSSRLEGFDLLHPAVQHHVVNSLGWRSLRPLQRDTVVPILAGEHVLAMAPTAGGKTEAAILPVLSRMLTEQWSGLTVLYLCPLRALLNNLHIRLSGYAELVGRRVGLWHGDVTAGERSRLLREPPDILLTTPESLEAMLVSTSVAHDRWFKDLRTVVIDEAHAFAADDRGWHMLAVLARLSRLAGREIQRVALSATIGNPDEVLTWVTTGCGAPRHVINPAAGSTLTSEVTLDYVGSLDNAATVISRLHRGAKRLVFVDSRARAEQLAAGLRARDVATFVSHGSLGLDERRQAELAFAEARDCVIVATSTLELGIDVGDLDHVLQIDAPPSVASFLQRLGRSGRRTGSSRNMTLLATSDESLLLAASVLLRWSEGYVEPTTPPPLPLHLLAQQLIALALQEGQFGRHTWRAWFGEPFVFGEEVAVHADKIIDYLIDQRYLIDGGAEMLSIGDVAERELGRRHFMELLAVFTSPPLFSVRHGRSEIGQVPDELLLVKPAADSNRRVLLLAGKSWTVTHVDWRRRVIHVEPSDERGIARWAGGGALLGAELARGVRDVLTGADAGGATVSRRAAQTLGEIRSRYAWVRQGTTTLVANGDRHWWTFAGQRANLALAEALTPPGQAARRGNGLSIPVHDGIEAAQLRELMSAIASGSVPETPVSDDAIANLKFSSCLPPEIAKLVLSRRLADHASLACVAAEPLRVVHDVDRD